ncbi:type III polyketide synthase [Rhodopirellula sp. JC639]|uniref:type III polyketide synthase n=1 Tax=Stieleria mannarensis TaxID=2755585 RepID=UPI0016025BC3|nr:type III polyketide synthase [Rhodopirellula sp. JC639]
MIIDGLGTATPAHGITQSSAAEIAQTLCCDNPKQSQLLSILYQRSGVRYRHSVALESSEPRPVSEPSRREAFQAAGDRVPAAADVAVETQPVRQTFFPPASSPEDCGPSTAQRMELYERHAGRLGAQSVAKALDQSSCSAGDIDHLITISCTGFYAPGLDVSIIKRCGLSPSVGRTHIGFMGCHGALNGLRVAQSLAQSNPRLRILMCAVELCTLHQQYGWHPERVVSNALFADGAAALVARTSSSPPCGPKVMATGSTILPDSEDLMRWRIGDHGFEMTLSPRVPTMIRRSLQPWLRDWLGTHQLAIDDIRGWAIHPGGPKILQACGDALQFRQDELAASRGILAEYGNMSSPTVLFILQRLLQAPARLPCVMLGFGPGLSIEAALVA